MACFREDHGEGQSNVTPQPTESVPQPTKAVPQPTENC